MINSIYHFNKNKYIIFYLLIIISIYCIFIFNNKSNKIKIENFTTNNEINNLEKINKHTNKPKAKLAFCFLTIDNIHQDKYWQLFFNNNNDRYNIYIHPKYPDKVSNYFKKYIIKELIETKWGDLSLVNATINLYREAYKDEDNKIFILVSDSCIPIYDFDYIYNKFINEYDMNNVINIINTRDNQITLHYNNRFIPLHKKNPKMFPSFNKFKKQSQWCAFNRPTVNFIINNNYTELFNTSHVPDEHYFINIFEYFNIPYKNIKMTFDNWIEKSDNKYKPFPKTYTKINPKIINNIKKTKALFMRKVVPETEIIL